MKIKRFTYSLLYVAELNFPFLSAFRCFLLLLSLETKSLLNLISLYKDTVSPSLHVTKHGNLHTRSAHASSGVVNCEVHRTHKGMSEAGV
jgi:hypothetical protein